MSLKLGNTNIAGTQILYSTTGNNTDGAMNQAVTTAQLNLKANDTDVVHKTGSETIGGAKTFENILTAQSFKGNNGINNNCDFAAVNSGGWFLSGDVHTADVWQQIITQTAISKNQNGYVKFDNGLIIQWGRRSTTDGYVTFPTPFSNACTAVIPTRISSGDAQSNIFENASTTRFKIKIYGGYSSSSYFYWIAVGY